MRSDACIILPNSDLEFIIAIPFFREMWYDRKE